MVWGGMGLRLGDDWVESSSGGWLDGGWYYTAVLKPTVVHVVALHLRAEGGPLSSNQGVCCWGWQKEYIKKEKRKLCVHKNRYKIFIFIFWKVKITTCWFPFAVVRCFLLVAVVIVCLCIFSHSFPVYHQLIPVQLPRTHHSPCESFFPSATDITCSCWLSNLHTNTALCSVHPISPFHTPLHPLHSFVRWSYVAYVHRII